MADMNPMDEHDNRAGFEGELISTTEDDDQHLEGVWGYIGQIVEVK